MKRIADLLTLLRILLIFSIVFSIPLFGCESKKQIRIGFIGGITGRVADMGGAARDAVQLAVAQCNEQGGIAGRQIKLIIKDDQHDAELAIKAVRELIKEDVAAIVGPLFSDMAIAVKPFLDQSQVIAVGTTVTTQYLSGSDDYFFRVCFTTREHASCSARYQLRSGGMRRIAVAYDGGNRSFSENWLENFKSKFMAGGGEILTAIEFRTEGGRSFSEIAQGLLAVDPDGILIIANSMDSALLCQQIRKSSQSVKITLSNWGATQRLIEMGGKAVEGATMPIAFDWNSPSTPYQSFRKIYFERYRREPGFSGAYAYDAAQVVLTALKARERGQHLKETILSIREFDGLQGKINFDQYGDVKQSNASIRMVRNQKFVVVE